MTILKNLRKEILIRMIVDGIVLSIAFFGALIFRMLALFLLKKISGAQIISVIDESIIFLREYLWVIIIINLIVFYISGFYTRGRAYRSRYKALMIFQAVTISYILIGFISYFYPFQIKIPRSAWISGWILSLLLIFSLRFMAQIYKKIIWQEAKVEGKPTSQGIKNVTVIGGAGYIGSVLVRKLLEGGYNVTILDAFLYGKESINGLENKSRISVVEGDIRRVEDVVKALELSDAVIHLAAIVGDPACAVDEKLSIEINLAATRMIAEVARGFGVKKFIFASTCSVYGTNEQKLDEYSEVNPLSVYAKTKLASEKLLLKLGNGDFNPIILRFSTVYGLSYRPRFDLVVNTLTAKAVTEGAITIFGGDQWRPFIHVDDVANAIIKVLDAPKWLVNGKIYNVGSDNQNYTISQIGEIIREIIPGVDVRKESDIIDKRNYNVSFSRIYKELGFEPIHKIEDGVIEIKEFIEKNKINYKDEKYNNYLKIKKLTSNNSINKEIINKIFLRDLE